MVPSQPQQFFLAKKVLEMLISSLGTEEKVNEKIALQKYIVFCNLDCLPADIQIPLTATHCYLSDNPWVGILGSNRVQRDSFFLSWAFASFLRDVSLFLVLK